MRKNSQLYGLLMRPCSFTQEEHEEVIFSSEYAKRKDFKKEYQNHIAGMQILAESAKIYILNNWKKVKKSEWKFLSLSIIDNTGKETYYYNYVEDKKAKEAKKKERELKNKSEALKKLNKISTPTKSLFTERMLEKWDKRDRKNNNPVKTVSGVVLDTTDGDFSIKINGHYHLWIDNESVIVLADFIENKLSK